jgi:molybdopterin molybdotransferase
VSTATELISVTEAQRLVLERARRLDAERVPIERAAGRVLAEPAAALTDLPPFPSSAMDGFAVRADEASAGARLPVVARIAAGMPADRSLGPGD